MVRYKKLDYLIEKGINIKYHFEYFKTQRRLIIDEVEKFSYTSSGKDQSLAGQYVDLLYWEYNK